MTASKANKSRVPGTKVLKLFLQTFGKMELQIFTLKTIFPMINSCYCNHFYIAKFVLMKSC